MVSGREKSGREKRADLKAIDGQGLDAVMIAAGVGAVGNLKILLNAGATGASLGEEPSHPCYHAH